MRNNGQTIMEYIILISIVTMAVYYMGPAFKRGFQSLIKITADQVGNQANADQEVDKPLNQDSTNQLVTPQEYSGYLVFSNSSTSSTVNDAKTERLYVTNSIIAEQTNSITSSGTDMGYTKEQN